MSGRRVEETICQLIRVKRNVIAEVTGFAWKAPAIDDAIAIILEQQTEIANLKYDLEVERMKKEEE